MAGTLISQAGTGPWASRSWAGYVPASTGLTGGLQVTPDSVHGVMQVQAWWPDATILQLIRITPDGVRTAVRGGYPLTTGIATRRNYCTNPSMANNLTGYVAGAGSPTLSTITRTDLVGTPNALRATIASAGTDEVQIPHALPGATSTTIGVDQRVSASPSALTVTVAWKDATGASLTSSTATLTASVGTTWTRQVGTVVPPSAAATTGIITITAAGLPAGATLDLDRVMIAVGAADDGSYTDGDATSGQWTGTAGNSTSVVAPLLTVADGECPLDVPVVYELYQPGYGGGRVQATAATLAGGDTTWLTHPSNPGSPMAIQPLEPPVLTRQADQAVYRVLGRTNPVVVSTSARYNPNATFNLLTQSFAERDALLALLADLNPVYLRAPAAYGYGYGWWLSVGELAEDPRAQSTYDQVRVLTAPVLVVDPPAGPTWAAI